MQRGRDCTARDRKSAGERMKERGINYRCSVSGAAPRTGAGQTRASPAPTLQTPFLSLSSTWKCLGLKEPCAGLSGPLKSNICPVHFWAIHVSEHLHVKFFSWGTDRNMDSAGKFLDRTNADYCVLMLRIDFNNIATPKGVEKIFFC